ncbi:MFS general substrate transporter [Daedalea quercina L-15889]|uniref:MFS general substrate transporter n=1 Tax=Daedalea quercina L-15889 TaxID=1314783 RepID=A0A165Q582_9APHY|nr:MFS general substrate transporter [Daedalea quercina L-15889]
MTSAQGIELRTVGQRQGDQISLHDHDDPIPHSAVETSKSNAPETPQLVVSPFVSRTGEEGTGGDDEPSAAQAKVYRWRGRLHFATLCYSYFLEGWNDGTLGPLLPRIQQYYDASPGELLTIVYLSCQGFIGGAMANVYLNQRIGFGKMVHDVRLHLPGAVLQLVGYIMVAPAGPFALMNAGVTFAGLGIAMQMAQCNGFVGSLKQHVRLHFGVLHACYGLGAFVSPLVATHFATVQHWSFHYIIAASIAASNIHECQIGWIVTFVEDKRGGNATAGYISSGFFGGLMLGRLVLLWFNRKLGERWSILTYGALVIALEVTIWTVPSLFENAVAVSFIGLFMGPMYPIMMNHSTALLPHWLRTGSMGYIAGIGQTGSAVLPLVTGLLASKFGIGTLQPLVVSMVSTMLVIWAVVPRARRFE